MFKELNPLLHSELSTCRNVALFISVEEAVLYTSASRPVQRPATLVCNWINLSKRGISLLPRLLRGRCPVRFARLLRRE